MKWIGWIALLLLTGCQQPVPRDAAPAAVATGASAEASGGELRNLIDFSNRFQARTRQDQLALCAEMRRSLGRDDDRWTGWYLATAISQVEGCGEPEEAVALITELLEQRIFPREIGWLAYYQISLLQQQLRQRERLREAGKAQQELQKRLARAEQERRLLKRQLDDLKRIETSINQRLDEKQQETKPPDTEPAGAAGR